MTATASVTIEHNSPSGLTCQVELERTSESDGGSPAVAVSGYAEGEGAIVEEAVASSDFQATNRGGGGSGSPLLDYYAISRRKLRQIGDSKNPDKSRRVCRFYQRYFTGVGVGGQLRILTLTSSDEAVEQGFDIHRHFTALVKRLRRRWGHFEYIGVVEVKGDRQHLHLVFRGEYMAQVQVSAMWQAIHASPVVDIRAVWGSRGGARYLAKYLAKEAVNRYWASYNWVFQGWVGWSKRVKRAVGHYPSRALLRSLAVMDKVKRRLAIDFFEYQYPVLWQYSFEQGDLTSA